MRPTFLLLAVALVGGRANEAEEEPNPIERWIRGLEADDASAAVNELSVRGRSIEGALRKARDRLAPSARQRVDALLAQLAERPAPSILFERKGGVWRGSPDAQPTRLPSPQGSIRGLAWAPDGRRFAVVVLVGGRPRLFVATPDGKRTSLDLVSRGDDLDVLSLEWSPDGRWLACACEYTEIGREGVQLIDLHSNSVRSITPGEGRDVEIAWAPGSDALAIASVKGSVLHDDGEVVREDWDAAIDEFDIGKGTRRRMIAATPGLHSVGWSPDGRQLAWTTMRAVFLGTTDGKRVLRIYDADIDAPGEPLWSPDGSRLLVHQAALPPGATDPISDLRTRFVVFEAEGKEVARWMANGRAEAAVWSPDGKRIVWVDGPRVVAAAADGEGERVVADEADGYSVSWQQLTTARLAAPGRYSLAARTGVL